MKRKSSVYNTAAEMRLHRKAVSFVHKCLKPSSLSFSMLDHCRAIYAYKAGYRAAQKARK